MGECRHSVKCIRIKVTPLKEVNDFNKHEIIGYKATTIGHCGNLHQVISDTKHHAELCLKSVVHACPECQEALGKFAFRPLKEAKSMV